MWKKHLVAILPSKKEVRSEPDGSTYTIGISLHQSNHPNVRARFEVFKAMNGVIVPNSHHIYIVDTTDKSHWQPGDTIHTSNMPIETIKAIDKNYSTQKGYEWLITVEGNRNQYKPVEIFGKVIATTDPDINLPRLNEKSIHQCIVSKFINVAFYLDIDSIICYDYGNYIRTMFIEQIKHIEFTKESLEEAFDAARAKKVSGDSFIYEDYNEWFEQYAKAF